MFRFPQRFNLVAICNAEYILFHKTYVFLRSGLYLHLVDDRQQRLSQLKPLDGQFSAGATSQ